MRDRNVSEHLAHAVGRTIEENRPKIEEYMDAAKKSLEEDANQVRKWSKTVRKEVTQKPFLFLGLAFAVGLTVGLLMQRSP